MLKKFAISIQSSTSSLRVVRSVKDIPTCIELAFEAVFKPEDVRIIEITPDDGRESVLGNRECGK